MSFRFEKEMLSPAIRWLKSQSLMVLPEYAAPWGICDLVGMSFDKHRVDERLALGQTAALGSPLRVGLFLRIPDQETRTSISLSRLGREFGAFLDDDSLKRHLDFLIESKFVRQSRKSHFQRLNGWAPLHHRIVAVELKLDRIEEVLSQAKSHVRFAGESLVGLPYETAHRVAASRAQDFEDAGVGILAVGSPRSELLLPSRRPVESDLDILVQSHCVEAFWRQRRPRGKTA